MMKTSPAHNQVKDKWKDITNRYRTTAYSNVIMDDLMILLNRRLTDKEIDFLVNEYFDMVQLMDPFQMGSFMNLCQSIVDEMKQDCEEAQSFEICVNLRDFRKKM